MNIRFNNEIAREILLMTAKISVATALTATIIVMPGIGVVAKEFLDWYKNQSYRKRFEIRKTFKELRKARLINSKEMPDGSTKLTLSDMGKKKVLRFKFEDLKLNEPKKWNGKWHFIIFDFPKRFRRERELWRRKLKDLGFYQLQRSVWVHAFPCRDEINFMSEYLNLSPYVRLLEVSTFDGSGEVKNHFF